MKLEDKPFNQLTLFEHLILALSQNPDMVEKPYYNRNDGAPIYEQNAIRIINQAEFILAELDRRYANK